MSKLCPTCDQIKPKSFWLKHAKKELNNAWLEETMHLFKHNAQVEEDFNLNKNLDSAPAVIFINSSVMDILNLQEAREKINSDQKQKLMMLHRLNK
jgi:hypothetical protein